MSFVPAVLKTVFHGTLLCSVDFLLHSVVLGDLGLALVPAEKGEEWGIFWWGRKLWLLCTIKVQQRLCLKQYVGYKMLQNAATEMLKRSAVTWLFRHPLWQNESQKLAHPKQFTPLACIFRLPIQVSRQFPAWFFVNYAYMCTWIRGNLNHLFSKGCREDRSRRERHLIQVSCYNAFKVSLTGWPITP